VRVSVELVASLYKGQAFAILTCPDIGVPVTVSSDGTAKKCVSDLPVL